MSLPKLGYFLKQIPTSATIKNTVSTEPSPELFPGYSASGQDIWVQDFDYNGDAIIISAVGARCGKTFCATGKWGAIANTSALKLISGNLKYYWYLTNQSHFWEVGGAAQPYVKISESLQKRIFIPEIAQQSSIADYLDRETGRIDGLIEKKTRFIELLKEKRAAVIDHAVSKGIDPNARMKPSGVEWLGDIPDHWHAPRIATLFREAFRTPNPDLPVLSVSIHTGVSDGELSNEERDRKVALSEDRTKYQGVEPGDLVYNMMRAWQGAFGAVAVSGLVSPAYVVAKPIADFRTKFLEHLLHTQNAAEEIRRYSRGIADFRMRLYWEFFRNIRVCLPPLPEQDKILTHIERETKRIDSLIKKTERSIALLKEKRAALITAAVTGKIDVRTAA